ncbi:hypothetical protein PhaeoP23_03987 (plasmid) [Phaeobacter piscinae]|uniref:NYN domain-containing protein n=1 Tax=Phaeobacter piscinae TaxID=1580596 RepID=A0ABM6PLD4_9RHOB|nr:MULTISPECIES: NYN domain-containing protein [Phaeobacter]ATG38140.1 hypothetical protein PhaeoP36_04065 [Phaeobacter piscinae]AUQ88661.1 hypothetical protein PhaeoP42_04066 [Phaeobacter piscinae]AUQ92660.1 hypothetical protein PhaeoP24_04102 [Phaeobacter inhibens]AUR26466.1 hypothetical protein PhaeoP23_03987 [Phaeobacter piscinae]
MFYREERLALFIDGSSTYTACKEIGLDIDYKRLREVFSQKSRLIRIGYYASVLENGEHPSARAVLDWMSYNGFHVTTKTAREYVDDQGQRRVKGSMEVDIAVDMMALAQRMDHAVLVSGNGDFVPVVAGLQQQGVRVSVLAAARVTSDALKRQADNIIDLNEYRGKLSRDRN